MPPCGSYLAKCRWRINCWRNEIFLGRNFLSGLEEAIPRTRLDQRCAVGSWQRRDPHDWRRVNVEDVTALALKLQSHPVFHDPVLGQHHLGDDGLVEFDLKLEISAAGALAHDKLLLEHLRKPYGQLIPPAALVCLLLLVLSAVTSFGLESADRPAHNSPPNGRRSANSTSSIRSQSAPSRI